MTRIIAISSGKGGVGKTTVTANLAVVISKYMGLNVTVIDANVTASHLAMHFGEFRYGSTLNDVLRGDASLSEAIIFHPESRVQIVPASINLSDLKGVDITILGKKIRDVLPVEDYILIDSAPGFGREAIAALMAADEAIIVTTPDVPSLTDVLRGKKVLEDLGIKNIGLVVNKVMGKRFEPSKEEIEKFTNLPVIAQIPFSEKFLKSLAAKKPLALLDPKAREIKSFLQLASYISGENYSLPKESFLTKIRRLIWRLS